ncbi:N-acetylmuramoyl-L-alanine amidase [Streptomyces griseocarneus]|nr:N-acetylmuramoyl-L-alanine amidase [Streptomyces griseocarneus]
MAPPMSANEFLAALRREGATVVEVDGWRNHNRAGHGPWGPVNGVMIHHTASSGIDSSVRLCWNGYTSLPGPLCHGVIAKDGRIHLVGCGRANHAGGGDGEVLQAVIAEKRLPPVRWADTDGNVHFYGFECVNLGDGEDPWPEEQMLAIEQVAAAICRFHGWTERSVIGHLEWRPGKVDPVGFSMDLLRERVGERLK